MKRTVLISSLITAGFLAATPALADVLGTDNPDIQASVLNDLDKPAFVGTGMSVAKPRAHIYQGFAMSADLDGSGFGVGSAKPEGYGPWGQGNSDAYGTILTIQ